jgi:hypothetical protein
MKNFKIILTFEREGNKLCAELPVEDKTINGLMIQDVSEARIFLSDLVSLLKLSDSFREEQKK